MSREKRIAIESFKFCHFNYCGKNFKFKLRLNAQVKIRERNGTPARSEPFQVDKKIGTISPEISLGNSNR
jgi:hypothetical protein